MVLEWRMGKIFVRLRAKCLFHEVVSLFHVVGSLFHVVESLFYGVGSLFHVVKSLFHGVVPVKSLYHTSHCPGVSRQLM